MSSLRLLPFGALVMAPVAAYATTYLSVEEAQKQMLPGRALSPVAITLSDEQVKAIVKASGEKPLDRDLKVWRAADGSWFIVDQVVGKHEFITYAVTLDHGGAVRDVEILDYRETFGDQVREADWRAQFHGKTSADPLQLTRDIRNVSGATLSCKHITGGVRRVLATWQQVLAAHA